MITLNAQDKTKLEAALARANGLELITTDVDGVYFVRSGEAMYMVVIAKQDGFAKADCNCEGGKRDLVCKHAALALQAHKEKLEAAKEDELPVCHDCGASAFAYVEGNWFCANCIAEAAAEEAFKAGQMPEIDFDANPNEQQCQECLRLWVNNTEFAYKVCPDCRTETTRVEAGDTEGQRWAQEEAEDEAFFEAESKKLGPKCAECGFMRVANEGDTCEVCIEGERLDREEFIMTEVLQPRYQRRTYSWPTRSLEEVEEASPEPEHIKYEESIAEARRSLFGEVA
jgi:hypothetical protein